MTSTTTRQDRFLTETGDWHFFRGKTAPWVGLLLVALSIQGILIAHSPLWALPIAFLAVVAVAGRLPIVPLLGAALVLRALTDNLAAVDSRSTAAIEPSAAIAGLLILVAIGLLLRRRRGIPAAMVIGLALFLWTGVAVYFDGVSAVTAREGFRELSIVAVAIIALNAGERLSMKTAVRIIQLAGAIGALLALFQLATSSGMLVAGQMRANGSFGHPNAAAVFFAVAATSSLWIWQKHGKHRMDLAFFGLFSIATLSTFSITGFVTLLVMIAAFVVMQPGSARLRAGISVAMAALILVFVVSPLGSERVQQQAEGGDSLSWRFGKWGNLLEDWQRSPVTGIGLGITVSAEAKPWNATVGAPPHNEYVRYLVETGILGSLLIVLAVAWLLTTLFRRRELEPASEALLATAVIAGLLVNALTANTALYTPAAYAAALLIGTALRDTSEEVSAPTETVSTPNVAKP